MGKTRIHDLAAEFGIESQKLIELLAEIDIHVRSHLSGLDEGQVARIRTRWEREKRRKPQSEDAPKPRARRRKKAATTAEPAKKDAAAKPVRRRRTKAEVEAKAEADEEVVFFEKFAPLIIQQGAVGLHGVQKRHTGTAIFFF